MMRSGGVWRLLFVLSLLVGFSACLGSGWSVAHAEGKVAAVDINKAAPAAGTSAPTEGKGLIPETRMASSSELLGEAPWKVAAALVVLVVLAVFVVRLGKRFRPQWRGDGPIFLEDGRNLAPGVGVRLIRVGARYWLIGVTREQVTLLAELTEEDLVEGDLVEEEEEPAVDLVLPKGRPVRGVHEDEPSLVDRGLRR